MTKESALAAAQSILANKPDKQTIRVLVDNPNDCAHTIKAFRSLGCKVKVENDGAVLIVIRAEPGTST